MEGASQNNVAESVYVGHTQRRRRAPGRPSRPEGLETRPTLRIGWVTCRIPWSQGYPALIPRLEATATNRLAVVRELIVCAHCYPLRTNRPRDTIERTATNKIQRACLARKQGAATTTRRHRQ
ncbi:unnamed protein product [Trichogramma brassicae]|uniref:Uncharacterized protein n=1 Tax=Trichogramma brassicae TaxID=86971 RepID=A0A6H5I657_9HYME|nr:unnamed protein product [Trichogramma brassicae]